MNELNILRVGLASWLKELRSGLEPGRFRFCIDGGLVPVTGQLGLVSTCFAMRTAWCTGIWDEWPQSQREACIKFVKSFQREDGYFYDEWLVNNAKYTLKWYVKRLLGRVPKHAAGNLLKMNLRAETRQATGILLMVGERPNFRLPVEVSSRHDMNGYIESLDFESPGSAGSHLSHALFGLIIFNACVNS